MTNGNNLQVLFFCHYSGHSIGFYSQESVSQSSWCSEGVYLAFSKVIKSAMYVLPFGLFCLMADQVSKVGVDVLMAMTKLLSFLLSVRC